VPPHEMSLQSGFQTGSMPRPARRNAMGTPQQRPARCEDLFTLADNLVGETLGGELLTHPRPAPRQAHASSVLGIKIGGPFDQGEGSKHQGLSCGRGRERDPA